MNYDNTQLIVAGTIYLISGFFFYQFLKKPQAEREYYSLPYKTKMNVAGVRG